MSIAALLARLQLERNSLCAIVEGFTDRRLLSAWAEGQNLPAAVYAIDEIEVELAECYREYGGNKGRVLTLFSASGMHEFADKNAIGFVDRDIDHFIGKEIDIDGVYYTEFCCLLTILLSRENIKEWISKVFNKDISDNILDEILDFSVRKFRLIILKKRMFPDVALPNINKSVRHISEGGFDWEKYLSSVAHGIGHKLDVEGILQEIEARCFPTETRTETHLHAAIEYMWLLLRKHGVFDNTVSVEELYRHLRLFYLAKIDQCATARRLKTKALALVT